MNLGEKINKNSGKLLIAIIAWEIFIGLIFKIYNRVIYPIGYYKSWSEFWNAPWFSTKYFFDYWQNPFHIILYLLFILPLVVYLLITWYGTYSAKKDIHSDYQKLREKFIEKSMHGKNKKSPVKLKKGKTKI
jgi:hypothetical protein